MKKTHRPLTLTALLLALFMAAVEMTVVSTAMPTVVGDLGGIELYAWVFTAYLLASTVMVPIFGKLADLYGRKPILLLGITVFLIGSAASGLAQSMVQLIAFRAVQGFGAGAVQPMVLTVVGDIYTLEERAKVQGLSGAIWGFAGLVGPLMGGLIVEWLSWHWIFFLNLPVGLLAMGLIWFFLHENVERRAHELDVAGASLLGMGILCLLAGASGGELGAWPLLPAVVLLVAFVKVERRAKEPVLPLDLLTTRVIGLTNAGLFLIGGAMLACVTYVPLFVQGLLGGSATDAGEVITPMVLGWPVASALAGKLVTKVGFQPLIRLGLACTAVAGVGLAILLEPGVNLHLVQVLMVVFGVGMGFANTSLLLAVQSSVGWKQRGVATASTMFARTIGGALAVGALGGLLASALSADPSIPAGAADQLLGPDHGARLAPKLLHSLSAALGRSLHLNFWAIAGLAICAFGVGILFPWIPHRSADAPEGLAARD